MRVAASDVRKGFEDRKLSWGMAHRKPGTGCWLVLNTGRISCSTFCARDRGDLVGGMLEEKQRVSDSIGTEVEWNSQVDISTLMREKLGLLEVLGRRVLTQSLLEQLAAKRPLLKLVVDYKRIGKQLKPVESIIKEIRRGRVYPLFSQTRERSGRISSSNPDLFADDGLKQLRDCIGCQPAMWLQDTRRSLNLAQKASGDLALKKNRTGPKQLNLLMKSQAIMNELDQDDLLLRVLIGESSHQLSTHFLWIDSPSAASFTLWRPGTKSCFAILLIQKRKG
jgi:hypothetical protein